MWCRIDCTIPNQTKYLFVCGVYIPPEMSSYFDEEIFEELENDILNLSKKGNIMLLEDVNARTSNLKDFVSKEGNSFINDISDESFDNSSNQHGKSLTEICKNFNMRILKGRTLGDSFGKPTSHHKNGTSAVDYIICDQELTQTIENFIVKPPTYLSDHSQIVTSIRTKQHINSTSNITPIPTSTTHKLPYQFTWENNSPIAFTEALKSVEIQQKLESLINQL